MWIRTSFPISFRRTWKLFENKPEYIRKRIRYDLSENGMPISCLVVKFSQIVKDPNNSSVRSTAIHCECVNSNVWWKNPYLIGFATIITNDFHLQSLCKHCLFYWTEAIGISLMFGIGVTVNWFEQNKKYSPANGNQRIQRKSRKWSISVDFSTFANKAKYYGNLIANISAVQRREVSTKSLSRIFTWSAFVCLRSFDKKFVIPMFTCALAS